MCVGSTNTAGLAFSIRATNSDFAWYTASSSTGKPQYRLYNPNCTGAGLALLALFALFALI